MHAFIFLRIPNKGGKFNIFKNVFIFLKIQLYTKVVS